MRIPPEIRKAVPIAAAFVACLTLGRSANAFERQWHVGIDGGYAVIFDPGVSGFGGGAHAAYGISDSFNAMLELDVTHHPNAALTLGTGESARTFSLETVASGGAGIAYTIDVARAVPYVGVLAAGSGQLPLEDHMIRSATFLPAFVQRASRWSMSAQSNWPSRGSTLL